MLPEIATDPFAKTSVEHDPLGVPSTSLTVMPVIEFIGLPGVIVSHFF
jgi:hypothetical protein